MFYNAVGFKQDLCGAAWVRSKAKKMYMFKNSPGSISRTVCKKRPALLLEEGYSSTGDTSRYVSPTTQDAHELVSRRPIPERELIVRTPISTSISTPSVTSATANTLTCPKCGTFAKSGRVSCCAPGGTWYKKCGGASNKNVDHMWSEGVDACKRKSKACNTPWISDCYSVPLISFTDQCPRENTSSYDADRQCCMSQMRRHREIWEKQLLCSRRFLVQKLWRCW